MQHTGEEGLRLCPATEAHKLVSLLAVQRKLCEALHINLVHSTALCSYPGPSTRRRTWASVPLSGIDALDAFGGHFTTVGAGSAAGLLTLGWPTGAWGGRSQPM